MAAETPRTTNIAVSFDVSSRTLPVAPELVYADALGPGIEALGGSALSITINGPSLREASDEARVKLDDEIFGVKAFIKKELHVLGVYTVRQALAVGYDSMLGRPQCGPAVVDNIRVQIAKQCPGLRLLGRPTPEYVATFCRDLEEVPIAAIFPRNLGTRTPSVHAVIIRDEEACQRIPVASMSHVLARAHIFAPKFREARRRIEQT